MPPPATTERGSLVSSCAGEASRVLLLDAFLTPSELRTLRPPRTWRPSVVVDEEDAVREDAMRTSSQAPVAVGLGERLCRRLARRIGASGCLDFAGEGSWVRYEPGGMYALHGDAAGMEGGHRRRTLLVCLQSAEEGGETEFPALGVTHPLKPGQALTWENYDADGKEDEKMDHLSREVRAGTKIVINLWPFEV